MREFELRNKISIFLIVSQFILVITVFLLYLIGGYSFDEMTTTIALIFPILSVYTSGMIEYITSSRKSNQTSLKRQKISSEFFFITWFFCIMFILSLGLAIILKPFQLFNNFQNFKTIIAIIESLFGGFTGYILSFLVKD